MTAGSTSIAAAPDFATLESDLYHCSACNYCVEAVWEQRGIDHVCPTLLHHSPSYGYSGLGYLSQARAWREGVDLDLASLAERAFTCTTCGNCEEACPIGLRPARVVLALRNALNERDATPPAIALLRENVLREDNPAGAPRQARGRWARGHWARGRRAATDLGNPLLFLPGCAGCHNAPDEARAAAEVLESCGWRVEMLGDGDGCCGAPLHEIGFPADAAAKRDALAQAIRDQDAGVVAALGVECLEALNDRVSTSRNSAPRPRHPVLLLLDAMLAGGISLTARADHPPPTRVAVLDPCHVTKKNHGSTRDGDPAAAARAVLLAAGCDVADGAASSRFSLCCGAAGAMPAMNREAATRMAAGRIEGLAASGATAIVTISPLCLGHLRNAEPAPDDPEIWGFFEFLRTHFHVGAAAAGARP